jgi:hypothetical protein
VIRLSSNRTSFERKTVATQLRHRHHLLPFLDPLLRRPALCGIALPLGCPSPIRFSSFNFSQGGVTICFRIFRLILRVMEIRADRGSASIAQSHFQRREPAFCNTANKAGASVSCLLFSFAVAPFGPPTPQLVWRRVAIMCAGSRSASVGQCRSAPPRWLAFQSAFGILALLLVIATLASRSGSQLCATCQNYGCLYEILQFPDIARPVVSHDGRHHFVTDMFD